MRALDLTQLLVALRTFLRPRQSPGTQRENPAGVLAADRELPEPRGISDAIPQLVWTTDQTGAMTYVNRRWVEYTGLGRERSLGMGWLDALHPDDIEGRRKAWTEAVSRGAPHQSYCRLRCSRNGRYRWHLCRAIPQFDEAGRLVAWVGTFTDFDQLKRALTARDEVISVTSHELRTPLTALKLRLEAAARQPSVDQKLRERVESAHKQALRLEKMMDELLDFSRLVEGRLPLRPEPTELYAVTSQAVEHARPALAECGATVELSCAAPAYGRWDRARIEQVITTFLLFHAAAQAKARPVQIRVDSDEKNARLTVEDCGLGTKLQKLSQVFDDLERGTGRVERTGVDLGLYLAREIVVAHGGSIRVANQPGNGSRFTLELPKDNTANAVAFELR